MNVNKVIEKISYIFSPLVISLLTLVAEEEIRIKEFSSQAPALLS